MLQSHYIMQNELVSLVLWNGALFRRCTDMQQVEPTADYNGFHLKPWSFLSSFPFSVSCNLLTGNDSLMTCMNATLNFTEAVLYTFVSVHANREIRSVLQYINIVW